MVSQAHGVGGACCIIPCARVPGNCLLLHGLHHGARECKAGTNLLAVQLN